MSGTTAAFLDVRAWEIAEGEPFTDRDVLNANKVCLIGQTLVRELFQGESPLDLLRVEGMYSSFSVTWSAVADGRIQVLATLKYPGNRVEQRLLNLVEQDGEWRIDEITFAS